MRERMDALALQVERAAARKKKKKSKKRDAHGG
jgi:hypothetical protein